MTPVQDTALVKLFNDRVADKGPAPPRATADDPKEQRLAPAGLVHRVQRRRVPRAVGRPRSSRIRYSDASADK